MSRIFAYIRSTVRKVDPILMVCCAVLSVFSLVTVYGAVDNFGTSKLIMQLAMTLVGTALTFLIAGIDFKNLVDKLWIWIIIGSCAILAFTAIFGSSGASRETTNKSWLIIPLVNIGIQPSEFIKVTFICTLARHLASLKSRDINRPKKLLPLLAHAGIISGFVLVSGDLGVALIYLSIVLIMFFSAGLSLWYYTGGITATVLAMPFIWSKLAPYQQERIIYGFNPYLDPTDKGWQPLTSLKAIQSGGPFGNGMFGGTHYEALAASHTDFILATFGEKFGFVGMLLLLAICCIIIVRIIMIGFRSKDRFGMLVCVGVVASLFAQIIENVGMSIAVLPVVGITFPFMSCGGSSVLGVYIMMGLIHSIYSHSSNTSFRSSKSLGLSQ